MNECNIAFWNQMYGVKPSIIMHNEPPRGDELATELKLKIIVGVS